MAQKLIGHICKKWHWWFFGLFTALYVVLQYNRFFNILSWADTDDTLQYVLSRNLVGTHWLGPYNRLTLIKGIGFPAWTALLHQTHIPLWLGDAMLTIVSCAAVVYALRRTRLQKWTLVIIYGVLLFNPLITTRIYRDLITPSLALLVCAWAIGMFVTLTADQEHKDRLINKDLLVFTAIGVVSLPMWYYVREDPLWRMLFVYTMLGGGLIHYIRRKHWRLKQNARILTGILVLLVLPFVAVKVVGIYIASQNQHYYGRYVINDYFSKDFENAYAALSRIQNTKPKLLTIPVSQEMREQAYKVSPAFNMLEPCLDGAQGVCAGFKGAGPNAALVHDYEGGWFPFALRLAVERNGDYTSPTKAENYYLELTRQINTACASGKLKCNPVRMVDFLPLPTAAMIKPFISNWQSLSWFFLTLHYDGGGNYAPIGPRSPDREVIANYYRARYAVPSFGTFGKLRSHVLQGIYRLYESLGLVIACLSGIAIIFSTVVYIRKRSIDWRLLLIAWLLLVTVIIRTAMLTYVQVVSFPTANNMYLSSAYPLFFLFEVISISVAVRYLRNWYITRK